MIHAAFPTAAPALVAEAIRSAMQKKVFKGVGGLVAFARRIAEEERDVKRATG